MLNSCICLSAQQEMKFITFEEALVGANDPELHPSIRSKYVELVRGQSHHAEQRNTISL